MEDLNIKEKIQVAKMCAQKGMPIESLSKMGIDITSFPTQDQAEVHGIYAIDKIDKSINKTLEEELER